jgi:condensin complex subunit 1
VCCFLYTEAVEAVAESPDAISDPKIFNTFRSLLKHSNLLPGSLMSKLLDSISSGLAAECDSALRDEQADQETLRTHRTPLEMYAFLISWFAQAADKVKANDEVVVSAPVKRGRGRGRGAKAAVGRGGGARKEVNEQWNWAPQIPHTLAVIARVLARIRTPRIWLTTPERNTFIRRVIPSHKGWYSTRC